MGMVWVAGVALAVATGGLGVGSANADAAAVTCSGTGASPGVLAAGAYDSVTVSGACAVSAGNVSAAQITVTPGSALLAAFAMNDTTHSGTSTLTAGSISVGNGASLILGCEGAHFGCIDDPNPMKPTLAAAESVTGNITGDAPLGILLHNSSVGGNITQIGGGGGVNCTPTGPFAAFQSPVFSDYEDNTIGGSIDVSDLSSCWLGILRNQIGGSVTMSGNTMADPDAMEVLTNTIDGNAICTDNNPPNQFGDSAGSTNQVEGYAAGQCGFEALQPNPAPVPAMPASPGPPPTPAVPAVPAGPLMHISTHFSTPRYALFAADGGVFNFGVPFFGSAAGQKSGTVAGAVTPGGQGYCLSAASGQAWAFGSPAQSCASAPLTDNQRVTGMTAAPGGDGYYAVTASGAVFTSGNAPYFGGASNLKLGAPIVGIAAGRFGEGYFLAGADGGVLTYGGAPFYGSAGATHLNAPIVGIAVDPSTDGYWLVASDGGVFSYNAPYLGSLGATHLNAPIVGIAAAPTGDGYYLVAADGGVFTFGTGATYLGSLGAIHLAAPIIGIGVG
jgi:hypothetical protein